MRPVIGVAKTLKVAHESHQGMEIAVGAMIASRVYTL